MNPAPSYFSPVKEGRQILGEKTPNACLSPRHAVSPSKRSRIDTLSSSPKKLLPSPLFAGRKRSIDQVHTDLSISKPSDVVSRDPTESSQHEASQIPPREEMRQQRPDAMEQTPSDKQQQQQQQHNTESDSPKARDTRTVPEDPETRKLFIQEKACLLRTRLQNAMRHVRDPQFDRRLSELEEHSRKYPRLSFPEPSTPKPQSDQTITPRGLPPSTATPNGLAATPLFSATDPMKTPTQQSHPPRCADAANTSPMQLSSPGDSRQDGADPPSQRGDAVDGLLKLMNTAERRCESTWSG
ncbi:hypothetical protein BDV59DRAFT_169543 [Aspergillus ambiguus]|uniref:uncharacterized protein n=1 Tax=Aspergillus ambiguus TaxID=176160 RepID=UPI003CCE0291